MVAADFVTRFVSLPDVVGAMVDAAGLLAVVVAPPSLLTVAVTATVVGAGVVLAIVVTPLPSLITAGALTVVDAGGVLAMVVGPLDDGVAAALTPLVVTAGVATTVVGAIEGPAVVDTLLAMMGVGLVSLASVASDSVPAEDVVEVVMAALFAALPERSAGASAIDACVVVSTAGAMLVLEVVVSLRAVVVVVITVVCGHSGQPLQPVFSQACFQPP